MIYEIGNIVINSREYKDELERGLNLSVMREIINKSGCSLYDAKQLVDKIIINENIKVNSVAIETQNYCLAELQEEE